MARTAKKETALTAEEKLAQALVPEAAQPYQVPENWCWVLLSTVAQWGSGGTPSRKHPEYFEGNIPWIKTGELEDDYIFETEEHITEEAISNSSAKLFPVNTIAIAMYGATIGKVGILGVEATTNQACACGICTLALYYKYLFYYALAQKDAFIGKAKGGAQPNISQDIIKNHPIPLAPLEEQQRIVDRIESLFAKLDEAKEKAQAVVDGYEDRKAAILHKAITGELTAEWRKRNSVSIKEWRKKNLGAFSFVTKLAGFEYTKNIAPNLVESGIPLFKGKNVQQGKLVLEFESFIPKEVSDELPRSQLKKKCLLTPYVGTIGNIAIFDGSFEAHLGSNVGKIEIESETFEEFLLYYLRSDLGYKELTKEKKATAQESISIQAIRNVEVLLPTLAEQQEIVSILDRFIGQEEQAKETAEQVIDQIDIMKKAILARAFRGELGTNDPADESAEELLKRVL